MKCKILSLLFLLCGSCVYGQDGVIQKFANEAFPQIPIDTSLRYYYIFDMAEPPKIPERFFHLIPDIDTLKVPVRQFLHGTDTSTFKWTDYPVNKVRYFDRKHFIRYRYMISFRKVPLATTPMQLDSLELHGVIGIKGDSTMSEKKFLRLASRKSGIYYNKPEEERNYYVISKPVFTADKQYALVTVDENQRGFAFIFVLKNNIWKLLLKTNLWME